MNRSFSLFLALRYLKPRRAFLSVITVISILGVTLGITALIVVTSVMTGFDREMKDRIVGFDAHLFIAKNREVMEDWRALLPIIRETPGVTAAAPFVIGPVVAEFGNQRAVPTIRAVDPGAEGQVTEIADAKMYQENTLRPRGVGGRFDLESGDNCVLGAELAHTLGVSVGDQIKLYSPGNFNEMQQKLDEMEKGGQQHEQIDELRQFILPKEVTVTGIFSSGRYLYDAQIIYLPLYLGQELYGLDDAVHGIAARTADPYRADVVKANVESRLPADAALHVQTWMEQNEQLFTTVRVERLTIFIIVMIVMVVAAFCVMNTLITVTVLKTREIGVMKALGADVGQVVRVFLAQGVVVALFGVASGIGLGLGILAVRNPFKDWMASALHIELFPAQIYGLDKIPSHTVPGDVALICVCAFFICSLAALIPAYFAARLDPVRALRFE